MRVHPPSSTRSALLPQCSHTQDGKTALCVRLSVALGSLRIEITGPGPHLKGRYGIPAGELQINQKQGLVPGAGVSRPEGDLSVGSKFLLWSLNCGPAHIRTKTWVGTRTGKPVFIINYITLYYNSASGKAQLRVLFLP